MREEANFILELIVNSSLYHQRKSGRLDIRLTRTGQIVRKIQPIKGYRFRQEVRIAALQMSHYRANHTGILGVE